MKTSSPKQFKVLMPEEARAAGVLTKSDLKIIVGCLTGDPYLAPRSRRQEIAGKVQANIDRCWPKRIKP